MKKSPSKISKEVVIKTEKGSSKNSPEKEKNKSSLKKEKSEVKKKVTIEAPIKTSEKKIEVVEIKKPETFSIDFIYRREKETIKNLQKNYLISGIKKIISKKISVDIPFIKLYLKGEEIIDNKLNVFQLITKLKDRVFEVKKDIKPNENIVSLVTSIKLIYKIKCQNVPDSFEFSKIIQNFFTETGLENNFLLEPVGKNEFNVCFPCEDYRMRFKQYIIKISKNDERFKDTVLTILRTDKTEIVQPEKLESLSYRKNYQKKEKFNFLGSTPYKTYEDIIREQEKESKKKWIDKRGFEP